MSCYIVQEEDGVSRFELEEGGGFLVLEDCVPGGVEDVVGGGQARHGRRRRLEDILTQDEEDALAVILTTV